MCGDQLSDWQGSGGSEVTYKGVPDPEQGKGELTVTLKDGHGSVTGSVPADVLADFKAGGKLDFKKRNDDWKSTAGVLMFGAKKALLTMSQPKCDSGTQVSHAYMSIQSPRKNAPIFVWVGTANRQ